MLKTNIDALAIEQMQNRLHCAAEIIYAIQCAAETGEFSGMLSDALLGAYWYMDMLITDMTDLYEDAEKYIKETADGKAD